MCVLGQLVAVLVLVHHDFPAVSALPRLVAFAAGKLVALPAAAPAAAAGPELAYEVSIRFRELLDGCGEVGIRFGESGVGFDELSQDSTLGRRRVREVIEHILELVEQGRRIFDSRLTSTTTTTQVRWLFVVVCGAVGCPKIVAALGSPLVDIGQPFVLGVEPYIYI